MNMIHSIIAGLQIVMVLAVGYMTSYLYFEPRYGSRRIWEKINSSLECTLLVFKFLLTLTYSFLQDNYDLLELGVLSIGAILLMV